MNHRNSNGVCPTCGDLAEPALILRLLDDGMAQAEIGGRLSEISLELVTARPGDTVLVHAGVALARADWGEE